MPSSVPKCTIPPSNILILSPDRVVEIENVDTSNLNEFAD